MVPIVIGFYFGGGGVGVAVGALTVIAVVVIAAGQRPRGPIVPAPTAEEHRHVLLVVTCPVEEPPDVAQIVRAAGLLDKSDSAVVLVLAPARIRFLDRWASNVEPARRAAQKNLVATVAALAKAGVDAEARVGDEDVVQAVEDRLQTFPLPRWCWSAALMARAQRIARPPRSSNHGSRRDSAMSSSCRPNEVRPAKPQTRPARTHLLLRHS